MQHLKNLSELPKTWIFDIDGTIIKHNSHLEESGNILLSGVQDFFKKIPETDKIIFVTARESEYKKSTEAFLKKHKIRFDTIIYDCPNGERILINDEKPDLKNASGNTVKKGFKTAYAVNLKRNEFEIL